MGSKAGRGTGDTPHFSIKGLLLAEEGNPVVGLELPSELTEPPLKTIAIPKLQLLLGAVRAG